MAAFKKDAQVSLKGTAITLSGVVAENSKSRLVFKSSGNDKVICELVSTADAAVGSPLTVVGRVKGRGMLGNVTLDQCHPSVKLATAPQDPVVVEPAPEPVQDVSEESQVDQNADVPNPLAGTVSVSPPSPPPSRQSPKPVAAAAAVAVPVPVALDRPSVSADAVSADAVPADAVPADAINEAERRPEGGKPHVPAGFYALVGFVAGIGALLAFMKLRPYLVALFAATDAPRTEEMRRVALEALLLHEKKKELRRSR